MVKTELYVDEGNAEGVFKHKRLAEGLERAMYYCPKCGITQYTSKKDVLTCSSCGLQVRYLPTKELVGVGEPFPYRFTTEWYDAQSAFVHGLDLTPYGDKPLFTETDVLLSEVVLYAKKKLLSESASISLFNGRFEIAYGGNAVTLPFEKISAVTVLGKNKLNLYFDKTVWQFKGGKSMNALKFANLFYHYKNVQAGNPNEQFLGL